MLDPKAEGKEKKEPKSYIEELLDEVGEEIKNVFSSVGDVTERDPLADLGDIESYIGEF